MAMTYSTLIGAKSVTGSLASWVNYSKLQPTVVVDEAQALFYSLFRSREMMTDTRFSLAAGFSQIALPSRFLDPIGDIMLLSLGTSIRHKDGNLVQRQRNYDETSSTLGTDPFTTTNGSTDVDVALTAHGFSQGSVFNTSGATAFNGVTIEGTFPITDIDTNSFTIDITSLGATPNASSSGGGSSVAYVCDNLQQGTPTWWGIWNETIYFDVAFSSQCQCMLQYYQSLPLLSTDNETNFLTNRYPHVFRTALEAAAANFMKDNDEYNKDVARLTALVERINVENDMGMRGMDLDPIIP